VGSKRKECAREVVVPRIKFIVADEGIADLILELDDDVIGEMVLCEWW